MRSTKKTSLPKKECSDCTTLRQARKVVCKRDRELLRQAKAFIQRQNKDLKVAKITIQHLKTRDAKHKEPLESTVTALRAKAKKKTNRKLTSFMKKLKANTALRAKAKKKINRKLTSFMKKLKARKKTTMLKEEKKPTKKVTKKRPNEDKEELEIMKEHQDFVDEKIYEPLLKEFKKSKQTQADENAFIENLQEEVIAFYKAQGYIPDVDYTRDLAKDVLGPLGYGAEDQFTWIGEINDALTQQFRKDRAKAFRSKKRLKTVKNVK